MASEAEHHEHPAEPTLQFGYRAQKTSALNRGQSLKTLAISASSSSLLGAAAAAAPDAPEEAPPARLLSNAPAKSKNMGWLYRCLAAAHMDEPDYQYSEETRAWLAQRVDESEDVTDEQDTPVWWEHDKLKQDKIVTQMLDIPVGGGSGGAAAASAAAPSAGSGADEDEPAVAKGDLPVLTLHDVLSAPAFTEDFRTYLEDNFVAQALNFLEVYGAFAEMDPKADQKRYVAKAYGIYQQFVDPAGDEIVSVPNEVRSRAKKAIDRAKRKVNKRSNLTVDGVPLVKEPEYLKRVRDAMAEVHDHVMQHMETNLYPRFLRSDEYQEMLAVRYEADSESAGAAAAYKGQAWDNSAGYKSLTVTVHSGKDLNTRRKAWCLVTVDSRSYRTEASDEYTWDTEFDFQLLSTTQHVKLTVYNEGMLSSHVFCGRAFVPIAKIQSSHGAQWVKLLPRSREDKVSGEVRVTCRLSKRDARDLGHKLVETEDASDTSALANKVRGLVSKKKNRFKVDGFDLDLTYVTEHIVAMGYPSEGVEGVYRNNMEDVQLFFEKRHPHSYKLYNLCSERHYDPNKFKGRVSRYPFDDHNPPSMKTMRAFCEDTHEWLNEHPQNVAAIHCKAGKGRTGTVIAAYFVYAGMAESAEDGLAFFAAKRTKNNKGVTIPSQMRYVHYFEHYCTLRRRGRIQPPKASLFLKSMIFHDLPAALKSDSADVTFTVIQNNRKGLRFKSKGRVKPVYDSRLGTMTFSFGNKPLLLTENVKVIVHSSTTFGQEKLFQFWLNTRYTVSCYLEALAAQEGDETGQAARDAVAEADRHPEYGMHDILAGVHPHVGTFGHVVTNQEKNLSMVLRKKNIDKICKDKKHKAVPPGFSMQLIFAEGRNYRRAPLADYPVENASMEPVLSLKLPDPNADVWEESKKKKKKKKGKKGKKKEEEEVVEEVREVGEEEEEQQAGGAQEDAGGEVLKIGKLLSVRMDG